MCCGDVCAPGCPVKGDTEGGSFRERTEGDRGLEEPSLPGFIINRRTCPLCSGREERAASLAWVLWGSFFRPGVFLQGRRRQLFGKNRGSLSLSLFLRRLEKMGTRPWALRTEGWGPCALRLCGVGSPLCTDDHPVHGVESFFSTLSFVKTSSTRRSKKEACCPEDNVPVQLLFLEGKLSFCCM